MRDFATDQWLAEHFAVGMSEAIVRLEDNLEHMTIPEFVPPLEWAQENFYLSAETTGRTIPFEPFGYQVGIFKNMVDPEIEELYIPKATRTGISQLAMVAAAFLMTVLRLHVLMYQPTDKKAQEYSADYMVPAFRDSPTLSGFRRTAITKGQNQDKWDFIQLTNHARMVLSWASSDDNFRGKTTNVVMGDELDADAWLPTGVKSQGNKLTLAKDRYKTSEIFQKGIFWTSPNKLENSQIWPEWLKTDQEKYFVPCPHCGGLQDLKWGDPEDPEATYGMRYSLDEHRRIDAVWYMCEHCGGAIEEHHKRWMIDPERAEWRATNPRGSVSKRIVGMHINVLYVPLKGTRWEKIVEQWRASKDDPAKLKWFMNSNLGLPANAVTSGRRLDFDSYQKRRPVPFDAEVPSWVRFLTMSVDSQRGWKNEDLNLRPRHEVMVMGWAPGREAACIGYFILQDHEPFSAGSQRQLDEILFRDWKKADGSTMRIMMSTLDAGWKQEETIAYCRHPRRRQICIPTKGENETARELSPIVSSAYTPDDDNNRLMMVGTRRAKNLADELVRNEAIGPKYVHFPLSMGKVIKRFYTQKGRGLFAEEHTSDDKGVERWERRLKFSTGEVWDTLVGNVVAIEQACLRYPRQVGLVINDVEAASVERPANELLQDLSVMATVNESVQYGLVTGSLSQEDWDNDLVTIMPGSAVSAKKPDTQEKHSALAGIRMQTGSGRMKMRIRHAA